jgi:RNA polymerase sigma-70 factor (ECF subfamily)
MVSEEASSEDRWRRVFEAEHGRLWRSVLAQTGDPEVASDAVAEAFAQAIRRGDAVRDPVAWLWRSVFRIAGGQLAARRRHVADVALSMPLVALPSTDTLPDEVVALLDALARIEETDRRVVVLALIGGWSAAEVGEIVDASPGAVRVRLHRARRRLRAALADEASGPGAGTDAAIRGGSDDR